MDNGQRFPTKKPFLETSFDADSRTFQGDIDWSETTVNGGQTLWIYELVFSEDYGMISGGTVQNWAGDTMVVEFSYPDQLNYVRLPEE